MTLKLQYLLKAIKDSCTEELAQSIVRNACQHQVFDLADKQAWILTRKMGINPSFGPKWEHKQNVIAVKSKPF